MTQPLLETMSFKKCIFKNLCLLQVARRNARERNRVKGVNDGFGFLKKHVPSLKNKSSKVETLRGAIEYIKGLRNMLGEDIEDFKNSTFEFKMESGDDDGELNFLSSLKLLYGNLPTTIILLA